MKLNLLERLVIRAIYPQQSDLMSQIMVKDIDAKVSLSQKEATEAGLETVGQGLKWKDNAKADKDVDFSEAEFNFLKKQVERLDQEKKISSDLVSLCLKIKEGK